ncbi:MAG: DUF3019 domain-containing protein [Pseudohongiellaceae bacterium]
MPVRHTVSTTVGMRVRLVFLLLLMAGVPTDLSQVSAADSLYELQVRPRVCVTLASDSLCAMELEVSWSAPMAADVCLKLREDDTALQCWQQQRTGELTVALERDSNTMLQLLDASLETVLNEVEITVVSRDLKDSRRRRRHAWSIL